jgi:purine-nucleoside phosphorylase
VNDVLFVAAVPGELGDLDPAEAVGVGVIRAAAGLARVLADRRARGDLPGLVIQVGSCGAFGGAHGVGAVIVAEQLGLGDVATQRGLGYTPMPLPTLSSPAGIVALAEAAGAGRSRLLTNPAITTDEEGAAAWASSWHAEHMEAAAVGWACEQERVAWAVVLGVANRVGPGAHAEWLAHHLAAETAARAVAARLAAAWRSAPQPEPRSASGIGRLERAEDPD